MFDQTLSMPFFKKKNLEGVDTIIKSGSFGEAHRNIYLNDFLIHI
jgi:hypothetical protein